MPCTSAVLPAPQRTAEHEQVAAAQDPGQPPAELVGVLGGRQRDGALREFVLGLRGEPEAAARATAGAGAHPAGGHEAWPDRWTRCTRGPTRVTIS